MVGAQHDGAAGAQHDGAGSQQGSGQQELRCRLNMFLNRPRRGRRHLEAHGSGAQHGSGSQQVGAGAQQVGAGNVQQVGAGAQQVTAGAQHDGAGSQQGSGQQALRFLKQSNNPASAEEGARMLVKANAAASVSTFRISEFSESCRRVEVANILFLISQKHDPHSPRVSCLNWKFRCYQATLGCLKTGQEVS